MISRGASVPAKRTGQHRGRSVLSGPTAHGRLSARNFAHDTFGGKSNQFKSIVSATDHSGSAFAANLPAVAYLGGGSVFPTESPLFLQINHTHSQPLSNSVRRGSEIGMGEIGNVPKRIWQG